MSTDALVSELSRLSGTLAEWGEAHGFTVSVHPNGGRYVVGPVRDESASWELFHLTDAVVTSVSGPVYWLSQRVNRPQTP